MKKTVYRGSVQRVLRKAHEGKQLSRTELVFLLGLNKLHEILELFEAARALRERYFGNKLFLYGFIYFSTWCRNDCTFCYYKITNKLSVRYRKSETEILEAADKLRESGVHLIDLTMGEDPIYFNQGEGFDSLVNLVSLVKKHTRLPVMVSPGLISRRALNKLSLAGTDWYACYQETHNRELFNKMRINQNFEQRFNSKKLAVQSGLLIEEGILAGIGENMSDVADSMEQMAGLNAHQVRVMGFVPQAGNTPPSWLLPDPIYELKIIAVLRLLFPDRLIPASLDVDGVTGLKARLDAGANVVTSLVPPSMGLAGVAQSSKDINEGHRTVSGIIPFLDKMGLTAASSNEYAEWVYNERQKLYPAQRTSERV